VVQLLNIIYSKALWLLANSENSRGVLLPGAPDLSSLMALNEPKHYAIMALLESVFKVELQLIWDSYLRSEPSAVASGRFARLN